jgi:hypothetical protein
MDVSINQFVYAQIKAKGGSITAARGENLPSNVAKAVLGPRPKLTRLQKRELRQKRKLGLVPPPIKISHKQVYESVCWMVQNGCLARKNTVEVEEQYGSLPSPTPIEYDAATFSTVCAPSS